MNEDGIQLPSKYSDLSDWRFFCFRSFGPDSHAYAYLDQLCIAHGGDADWEDMIEPEQILDHIWRIQHQFEIEHLARPY